MVRLCQQGPPLDAGRFFTQHIPSLALYPRTAHSRDASCTVGYSMHAQNAISIFMYSYVAFVRAQTARLFAEIL